MKFLDRLKILFGAEVVNTYQEMEILALREELEELKQAHTELLGSYLERSRNDSNLLKMIGNAMGNLDTRIENIEQFCQFAHGKMNALEELLMEEKLVLPSMEGKKNIN